MTTGTLLDHSHHLNLLILSCVIAFLASYASLDLGERLRQAKGSILAFWITGSATVLGGGIWSMHFVAMLAFDAGVPVDYDIPITIVSLIIAIAFVGMGLTVMSFADRKSDSGRIPPLRAMTAGGIVGLGIAAMHYSGMSAVRLPGRLLYDPLLVGVSVGVAIVAATVALYLAFTLSRWWERLIASLVMAMAIISMHHIGMAALSIERLPDLTAPGDTLSRTGMAIGVGVVFFAILVLAFTSVFIDRQLEAFNRRESLALREANQQLKQEVEDRRAIEEALMQTRLELEQRVVERTRALADANQQLVGAADALESARLHAEQQWERAEQANHAKSDFLASMSHELRTPLNAILGFAQLLEMSQKEPLTARQAKHVGQIAKSGHHLLTLINDILDLSKIEAGTIPVSVEEVAITPLVDQLRSTLQTLADSHGITLDIPAPDQALTAKADRTRLLQILSNLVSNAIKYNRPNGHVTMAVISDGEMVRFAVTDTGMGIPPDRLADLFQPFNRLGQEHTTIEGTGIGLTIADRLAKLMGGRITVTSTVGTGSTFSLEVPLGLCRELIPQPVHQPHVADSQDISYRFLYVEDNPSNLQLMEELCETLSGVTLLTAAEPLSGLELARRHRPDLIILDINLPGMNGFEVFERLKLMPETATIPVVALSAAAMPREIDRGMALGFRHYLTKPLHVPTFLDAVKDVLGARPDVV